MATYTVATSHSRLGALGTVSQDSASRFPEDTSITHVGFNTQRVFYSPLPCATDSLE